MRADFLAEGHFRSEGPFSQPISQLRNEGGGLRNGTRVPKGCFAAAKHPAKWGIGCENGVFNALRILQPFRNCETRVVGYKMALVCQKVVSQLQKFLQRGAWGCEIISQQSADFIGASFGCEIISQPRAIFAEASF